jgi:hypothetical protein
MSDASEFPIVAYITDTETNEERAFKTTGWLDDEGAFFEFVWSEGNFACDCNRGDFYASCVGEELEDDDPRAQCGDGRYRVRITNADGAEIYRDEALQ